MIKRTLLAAAVAVGLSAAQAQAPVEVQAGSLTLREAWSRATPGGAKVGAGYLVIQNRGAEPDRLVAAEAEVSGGAEVHETVTADGVVRMSPAGPLGIPPNGQMELKPGAYHLMLNNLKRPLKEGERFRAVLTFEKAGPVAVTFVVRGMGAGPAGHHHH